MVTNFHSERPNRENGTTFSEFPFVPGIFQWDEPKNHLPLHSNWNFREFEINGKQPGILVISHLGCLGWRVFVPK